MDIITKKQPISSSNGIVTSNHPIASSVGISILAAGGNAFDAAAGAMLVEGLVNPQMFGMGGEGVMILKPIDLGVIFSRFSGLEKKSKTLSILSSIICSVLNVYIFGFLKIIIF